jgi:hypothetical protein
MKSRKVEKLRRLRLLRSCLPRRVVDLVEELKSLRVERVVRRTPLEKSLKVDYLPMASFCGADAFDFTLLFQNANVFFYPTS